MTGCTICSNLYAMIDWIAPKDIRYSADQLRDFLLPNLSLLQSGEYPPDPRDTGYERSGHVTRYCAPFCTPCEIAGEVKARIRSIPLGQIVVDLWTAGIEPHKVAAMHNISVDKVLRDSKMMIWYISGTRRKLWPYNRWQRNAKLKLQQVCV